MPAIVPATAAPSTSGPSMLKNAARTMAWPGRATRVATRVAMAFAASWNPLVNENASAIPIARTNPASTRQPLLGPASPEPAGRAPPPA